MADNRLDVETLGQHEQEGRGPHAAFIHPLDPPKNPEARPPKRLDGFPDEASKDIHPTFQLEGHSLLDRTDRSDWPEIVEVQSPCGGSIDEDGVRTRMERWQQ